LTMIIMSCLQQRKRLKQKNAKRRDKAKHC